jgi:hypothetical protein
VLGLDGKVFKKRILIKIKKQEKQQQLFFYLGSLKMELPKKNIFNNFQI